MFLVGVAVGGMGRGRNGENRGYIDCSLRRLLGKLGDDGLRLF